MTIQILVIGAKSVWREGIVTCLQANDMAVRTIDAAASLARAVAMEPPDVILLSDDLVRDRLQASSVEMLTLLRQAVPSVPVVMLGNKADSMKADSMEKIICLECGADDYVDMPCNPRELLSRIRNILRYRPQPSRSSIDLNGCCSFGDFVFNRSRLQLLRDGVIVPLQVSAMSLLCKLAEHPMKVLSRQALIEMLHGLSDGLSHGRSNGVSTGVSTGISTGISTGMSSTDATTFGRGGVSCERSLDVVVCRLRRVIESNASQPKFLQTVRGFGYVFNPSGAAGGARVLAVQDKMAAPLQQAGRRMSADSATVRPATAWFSEISFPARHPVSGDLASRSPA